MTKQAKRNRKRSSNASQGGSAVRGVVDTYQVVTDRIIEQLEAGVVPWRKPWAGGLMPQNLASGHEYRGINVFVLSCAPYASPFWVTYKQARDLGGSVKKGSKGWPIIFWSFKEKEKADGTTERYGLLRRFTVFNAEAQCENIELPELCEQDPAWNPIEAAEDIAAGFANGPKVNRNGNAAAYNPKSDTVEMPAPERFTEPAEFYSALFHELTHSSGHKSRLGREGVTNPVNFGGDAYSKEELCAEMGAAFLCGEAGILQDTLENSAAYIGGWLGKLKSDKRLVVHAAAQAQKAADLILGHVQSAAEADEQGAKAPRDVESLTLNETLAELGYSKRPAMGCCKSLGRKDILDDSGTVRLEAASAGDVWQWLEGHTPFAALKARMNNAQGEGDNGAK